MNWSDELKEKNLVKVFNASDRRISVDDLRLDLIDVKQKDWNQFLRDCPNDGLWIDLAELKKYLRANIVQ
jgi:hypothetical protein